MKISKSDLFIGFGWILISIGQTIMLGWESMIVWVATILIWVYIFQVTELNTQLNKQEDKK